MATTVAGIGFRPDCDAAELTALLAEAARLSGCVPALLAIPWFRAGEIAASVAGKTGLTLVVVAREAIMAVQHVCPTRSEPALRTHGIAAVAEGCALAAAGPGAILGLPRIASANATCAIAYAPAHVPAGSNA